MRGLSSLLFLALLSRKAFDPAESGIKGTIRTGSLLSASEFRHEKKGIGIMIPGGGLFLL